MTFEWLKHAFAVETSDGFEPTDAQRALVDRVCRQIVARDLATPALLFLESVRPLNYVSSQTIQFFAPLASVAGGSAAVAELAAFLEHRGSIDFLCRRLQALADEREQHAPPPADAPASND